MIIQAFSQSVIENLGYYVYLLQNPDTHEVFYVGKGKGNRIFDHLYQAQFDQNSIEKLDVIRAIQGSGKDVECIIQRHGLTEKEAFEVEASLIDFIGLHNLSNQIGGHHSDLRGYMRIAQIVALYDAPEIEIREPVILITVNRLYHRGIMPERLYEITRGNWKINPHRRKPHYALAVFRGIVREVYTINEWYQPENSNRWAFHGAIATNLQHYVGKSVAKYMKIGAQNPTKYVNC